MPRAIDPKVEAALLKLKMLPDAWRNHASGDGSALYHAGFEHCASELESALADFTVALDAWTRKLASKTPTPKPPSIKCLICRLTSYHPKDIKERFCGNCHLFHNAEDDGLTFELE